jgi:hypothetical protein
LLLDRITDRTRPAVQVISSPRPGRAPHHLDTIALSWVISTLV